MTTSRPRPPPDPFAVGASLALKLGKIRRFDRISLNVSDTGVSLL
ncbi:MULTISPECIES: hypothetical protein [unclassified Actinopolyspora]|nr:MULTISPECIES: hypothetical protein [unclassified Actinopolyspora]